MDRRVDRPRDAVSRPAWLPAALVAPSLALVAVFVAFPAITIAVELFDLDRLAAVLGDSDTWRVVWFSTWQATISTIATIAFGLVPTWVLSRHTMRGSRFLRAAVNVPFLLPTVVMAAACTAVLPAGLERGVLAIVVAHVVFNVAVVVRVVGATWALVPDDLGAAARTLGATHLQVARHVTWPLLRPAITAAAGVIFVFCFTSFGVVQILGGPERVTLDVEIARQALALGDPSTAVVLAALQLLVLVAVAIIARQRARRTSRTTRWDVANRRRVANRIVGFAALVSAVVVLAPIATLVVASLRPGGTWSLDGWRSLGDAEVRPGLGAPVDAIAAATASLRAALVASLLATVIGAAASFGLARRRRTWWSATLAAPLGVSAVVVGLGILVTFDRPPFDWRGSWWLVPIGQALVALPLVVRTVSSAVDRRPPAQLDAAATLGASPLRAFWEIDVRPARGALTASAAIAAAISLGEFGATTLLTRTGDETLPIAIARLLGRAGDLPVAQANALSTVLVLVSVGLFLVIDRAMPDPTGRR
jgi:thiamine transport system permease protein